MKLLALGADHRHAPASVRELVAFDGAKLGEGLCAFKNEFPGSEFVILSTCNRVELYAAGDADSAPSTGAMIDAISRFHGITPSSFERHLYDHHDEIAARHLFRVASSLESLVLGEGQILGQVKDAYRSACESKTVGPILHAVFQQAIRVGKKVRDETGMGEGKLSVASVAVDVARDVFDSFEDKVVLVIGAGKMADLTLTHLAALKPGRIVVTNRNAERARAAAERRQGRVLPFEELDRALIEADVVVSTTASAEPIVTYERFVKIQRARQNRLVLILDIAIPRDFEARIGDLEQVLLYNVDDLQAQADSNLAKRKKGVDPASAIVERETAACLAALRHQRSAGAVLRQLGDYFDEARRRELEILFTKCPHLTETDRQAISHTMHRLQNQVLHQPRAALRTAATEAPTEHPHPLLSAVRRLFGLAEI